MKIIGTLGGGGSSFLLRKLEGSDYKTLPGILDPYTNKIRLEKYPHLIAPYNLITKAVGLYKSKLKVLKRPDSFWTDWPFHPSGIYDPKSPTFADDLKAQKDYLIQTRLTRSAGLKIKGSDLSTDSLASLARSYLDQLERIEQENDFTIVLIAGHWGEYGILKELNVETIYLVRDPFNSLISHSKGIRHKKDCQKRGLDNINTKAWIDNYLTGPHHYWIDFASAAMEHDKAVVIRYNHFAEDWKKIEGLVDISGEFKYSENDIKAILTAESIDYIYEKTKDICEKLDLLPECLKQDDR